MKNKETMIGIMGAMPEEIEGIAALLKDKREETHGMRTYYSGSINGTSAVVVFSRWGKVAAATTVSTLMHKYNITQLIFTGVAGAISAELNIGDIVIGKRLIQHDMDGRPLMKQFEIPLLGKTYFECEKNELNQALKAAKELTETKKINAIFSEETRTAFKITQPRVFTGDIASGDQFFSDNTQKENLIKALPGVLCVEMEGAAVAQVCYEYSVPFSIIRVISDTADDRSHVDFPEFIKSVSSKYTVELIKNIFVQ
ncbi:MAG: 5'-methylthioadenosine/adenosylhomocysteine nucleosidase [Chitinophagaceae bacterium]|nr:MAG: 5'-methylthioadenosine/adenosylhomocysteine nucleosidase [Chitinophagaceae bacterium]